MKKLLSSSNHSPVNNDNRKRLPSQEQQKMYPEGKDPAYKLDYR